MMIADIIQLFILATLAGIYSHGFGDSLETILLFS
jgi:hypothetical protein